MPTRFLALVVTLLLLHCDATIAASCGKIVPGGTASTAAQWPALVLNPNPFIAFTINNGSLSALACVDARCNSTATLTLLSSSPATTQPSILVQTNTTLPFVAFWPGLLYWTACKTPDCASFTTFNPDGFTNGRGPAAIQVPGQPPLVLYDTSGGTGTSSLGRISCTNNSCTANTVRQVVFSGPATVFNDPMQIAAAVGADNLPIYAFIYNNTLAIAKATAFPWTSATQIVTYTNVTVTQVCRMAMIIGNDSLPLIAYCDPSGAVRVYACGSPNCTVIATPSPALAPNVGTGTLIGGYIQISGIPLSIAARPCSGGFPMVAFSGRSSGELGVIDCQDIHCSSGVHRTLYSSGTQYVSLAVPPAGHPLEGMPIVAYSAFSGGKWFVSTLVCFDGTCESCDVTSPQPAEPLYTPCTPPPPTTPPAPTTAAPTTAPPSPSPTPSQTPTPSPDPFGPCLTTDNCGTPPQITGPASAVAVLSCCNGFWVIEAANNSGPVNASASSTIEIFVGGSIYINNFWNFTQIDNLVIHIDGSGNKRQVTEAEARVKVNGDALVNGPLEIIVDSDPQPQLATTPIPVVAILPTSNGTLTGNFTAVKVTLAYPNRACSKGAATQDADNKGIDALVLIDTRTCSGGKSGGLSTGGKVAVGVVCGVVGLLLLLAIGFFAIRAFAPELAIKLGLKRTSAMTVGKSYGR